MRTTIGQDLQWLFAAAERGMVTEAEFARRKAELLTWSRCHLMLFTPRRLRFRA